MSSVKIVSSRGKEFILEQKSVAHIDPKNCVNCNECRETCPVGAIEEYQRVICHACPSCTDIPGISPKKFVALATEKSCTTACPLGISPQGYVNLIRHDKANEAYELVWKKNPLPSVCGHICHHPCEQSCKRGILVDYPIQIRELKRYLGETVGYSQKKYQKIYGEKIAIIGAGPAGLAAGHNLAQAGYEVTIFESATEAGGMLMRAIPKFRLDKKVVKEEIANLEAAGLNIRYGEKINKYSIKQIENDYDAVIIATGTPISRELNISGSRVEGIFPAMKFMEMVNTNQKIRHHLGQLFKFEDGEAIIIGGGSVAVDVARAAVRLGASKVTCVSSECGDEIPAHDWEIAEAKEEGVLFVEGWTPQSYVRQANTKLDAIKFERVTACGKDEEGKFRIETDPQDTMEIKADWVVLAIGQMAETFWFDLKHNDKVFFAGDIESNACSVVDAMASGRTAALQADAFIRGREVRDPMAEHLLNEADVQEKIYPYNLHKMIRPEIPTISIADRMATFKEVEGGFSDEEAQEEVIACMSCGYQIVNLDKCIGCGICQKVCPKGDVITMVAPEQGGM